MFTWCLHYRNRGQLVGIAITEAPSLYHARMRAAVQGIGKAAFQSNRDVTAFGERLEVAPRSAAEIEYREGRFVLNEPQQRLDVLADVVIARAFPEILCTLVVRGLVAGFESGDGRVCYRAIGR